MQLETTLSEVESRLKDVGAALLATDALAVERTAPLLRQAALDLSNALQKIARPAELPADLQRRIKAIRNQLIQQREHLARLTALTERQVATVLPPQEASTYGNGAPGRSGGAARIYRSQG